MVLLLTLVHLSKMMTSSAGAPAPDNHVNANSNITLLVRSQRTHYMVALIVTPSQTWETLTKVRDIDQQAVIGDSTAGRDEAVSEAPEKNRKGKKSAVRPATS